MSEWENYTLKDVVDIEYGKSPKDVKIEYSGIPIFGTSGQVGYSSKTLFEGPLIMIGRKGTINKPLLIKGDCWIIDTAYAAKPKLNIDIQWLHYCLINSKLEKLNEATGVPSLNRENLYNLKLKVPPLKEQQKIAAILSSVDEVIEKTEAIIEQTEKVKKGLMQQLLTKGVGHTKLKKTEIGEIPEEWDVVALGDIADFINGRGFKPHEWSNSGLPIIRIQNLNGGQEFNYYEGEFNPKILIEPDTLLFAWSGSRGTSFGPHIWKGETGVLNYHTWKVVSNQKVIKEFLYYSLRYITTKIENDSHGASALVHMQKGVMENYKIALPNLVEQEKLATVLQTLDSKLVNENSKLDQLEFLKKGLMQSLFTGKVRVKVDEDEVTQA
ncbi:restriction endonuclease subunit S [Bacillus cereus]|nr:restriction endonuclease subunit S [Bacillus cereus]